MANSREYLTVSKFNTELRIGFQRDMVTLADRLLDAGLIDNDCHATVTANPNNIGANRMLQGVRDSIMISANYFGRLISVLDTNQRDYGYLVDYLRREYEERGGTIADVMPPASQAVSKSAAAPGSTQQTMSLPPQDKPFALEVPTNLPDNFSEDFSPREFAQWMKGRKFLPDEDCQCIIDSSISGSVFTELDEAALKNFGFDKAGFYSLRSVLKKVAIKTIPVDSDGKEQPESESVPAMDRGEYEPKLKFESDDQVVELNPKQELKIPGGKGYYPMQAKKHGVCLIINNKTFEDPGHKMRRGTARDEYNLIETWRYLGYHVEVRREVKYRQIMKMLYGIDDLLSEVNEKSKSKVENDSFVCCILSHGNKFCIYSSDSKEVPIEDMERAVGGSDILRDKPKMFFIQACQGGGAGAEAVPSKLHEDKSGYVADGDEKIKTSIRSDIFISYAAAQGDQAYRHPIKGSLYVSALCKTLCEEAKQCGINDLQMYVNERVSDKDFNIKSRFVEVRQQPRSGGQLRRNIHFFFESTP